MAVLLLCSHLMAAPSFAAELIVWGVPNDRGLMAALRLFEAEHPGWEVVTSAGSSGGMDPQKLMCGIAGGSPPDMLQQDRFSGGEWAVRDAFLPLDDYIAQSLSEERWAGDAVAALAWDSIRESSAPVTSKVRSTGYGGCLVTNICTHASTVGGNENQAGLPRHEPGRWPRKGRKSGRSLGCRRPYTPSPPPPAL